MADVKFHTGITFETPKGIKIYNGTSWEDCTANVKIYRGSAWEQILLSQIVQSLVEPTAIKTNPSGSDEPLTGETIYIKLTNPSDYPATAEFKAINVNYHSTITDIFNLSGWVEKDGLYNTYLKCKPSDSIAFLKVYVRDTSSQTISVASDRIILEVEGTPM